MKNDEQSQHVRIQRLCDQADIQEVLIRYCRAVDRLDEELLRSVYWPDATDDHAGLFSGGAMDYVDHVIPLLRNAMHRTMHKISNTWMIIEGDVACSETYVYAFHSLKAGGEPVDVIAGGRYLDRLEKRDMEWRIAERKAVVEWTLNGAALFAGREKVLEAMLAKDTRNRADDSYRLFADKTMKSPAEPT